MIGWNIVDTKFGYRQVIAVIEESEAKIAAWALNAVAEGKHLQSTHVEDVFVQSDQDYWTKQRVVEQYAGPTEGVA